ncbi:MAG: hypothetical protein ACLPVY_08850 [Acidimicrobiia bacterium]
MRYEMDEVVPRQQKASALTIMMMMSGDEDEDEAQSCPVSLG